jgi:hypothetical protein
MSLLAIYCDDSGTDQNSRVAVVAGYIGQVAKWERFSNKFMRVLKRYGIRQMHRSDLENFHGEFTKERGWNEKRRIQFLQEVHHLIRTHTKIQIGSAVIKEDFDLIIPDNLKKQYGGVFGWCAQECIVAVSKWCEHSDYKHPIQWIFEAGTIGQGQVNTMFESLFNDPLIRDQCHIRGWSFQRKELIPLQAADVLTYEVFKHVQNQIVDRGKRPVRISMRQLMGSDSGRYMKYWDKERLQEWLDVARQRSK